MLAFNVFQVEDGPTGSPKVWVQDVVLPLRVVGCASSDRWTLLGWSQTVSLDGGPVEDSGFDVPKGP